jgi:uncharacterized UBP type Zn finger protein
VSVTTTPFLTLILQFPGQQFHEEPLDMRRAISITNLIEHFLSKQDDELTNYECNNCPTRQRATKTYGNLSLPRNFMHRNRTQTER